MYCFLQRKSQLNHSSTGIISIKGMIIFSQNDPVLRELECSNHWKQQSEATSQLPPRSSEVRDEFDLSASDNLVTPTIWILLPVSSENRVKYKKIKCVELAKSEETVNVLMLSIL
jgi:hypothetical protein